MRVYQTSTSPQNHGSSNYKIHINAKLRTTSTGLFSSNTAHTRNPRFKYIISSPEYGTDQIAAIPYILLAGHQLLQEGIPVFRSLTELRLTGKYDFFRNFYVSNTSDILPRIPPGCLRHIVNIKFIYFTWHKSAATDFLPQRTLQLGKIILGDRTLGLWTLTPTIPMAGKHYQLLSDE